MTNKVDKFLEFEGKTLFFNDHYKYWIAIKPICEVLGVDYNRQFKNIKKDPLFMEIQSLRTSVAHDNRERRMLCLPEFYIYLWILTIKSSSEELKKYRDECCKILFKHFKGKIISKKVSKLK